MDLWHLFGKFYSRNTVSLAMTERVDRQLERDQFAFWCAHWRCCRRNVQRLSVGVHAMNRCVRVVGEDGLSILPSKTRIVNILPIETFRDVLAKLVPGRELSVSCVQLQEATTTDKGVTDTREMDQKVSDLLQLVVCSQGFDPMMITYVVETSSCGPETAVAIAAETAAGHRDAPTQTDAAELPFTSDTQLVAGEAPAKCVSSGGSEVAICRSLQQQPRDADHQRPAARARALNDYLAEHACELSADDPGVEVVDALEAVLIHVTPELLQSLNMPCAVARSRLLKMAAAHHSVTGTSTSAGSSCSEQCGGMEEARRAIVEAIAKLHASPAVHR